MREQWLVNGRRLQMAGLAAAVGGGVLWAGLPAGAANDMTVTPTTNLKDGDTVEVTLAGWGVELAQVDLAQCIIGATSVADCDLQATQGGVVMSFGDGASTHIVRTLSSDVKCDKSNPCALVAFVDPNNFEGMARQVTLEFADDVVTTSSTTTTTEPGATTTTTSAPATTTTTSGSGSTTTTSTPASSTTTTTAGNTVTPQVSSTRAEATPADPVATKVVSPGTGTVQISEARSASITPPAGMTPINAEVKITAPAATVDDPHRIEFRLDATILGGRDENALVLLRNGAIVPACTGAPKALPDPCVSARARMGDDATLTALTSQAGTWDFAYPATIATTATTSGTATTLAAGSPAPVPTASVPATLPATGLRPQMLWLFGSGVVLIGAGSAMRRQAVISPHHSSGV